MTKNHKYDELLSFLQYHCRNNPKRTLQDIQPLLNELLKQIGETKIKEETNVTRTKK